MKSTCLCLALCVLVGGAAGQDASKPDLSTPEKAIDSFVAAFNRNNAALAAGCVQGGGSDRAALEELQRLDRLPFNHVETSVFSYRDVHVQVDGDSATVALHLSLGAQVPGHETIPIGAIDDHVKLHREGTTWKIVPADLDAVMAWSRR